MIVAAAAAAALLLLAVATPLVVRRRVLGASLPRVRGRLEVTGVSAPVTVARDRVGVPHVDAGSMPDAAFAMGVVHAQDRLWQMELSRRVAAGRVSEFAGPEGLPIDRFMRRLGLQRVAQEEARLLVGDVRQMLESYAAGVNSVISGGRKLPLEFRTLKLEPQPWRPVHSLAAAKLLALGLSLNWDNELQRLDLLRAIGPERAAKLDLVYPDANPTILASTASAAGGGGYRDGVLAMFLETARWVPAAGGGSNSWVVAGTRTATGRPILCNDPHLVPGMPSIWYAAHIHAGDDFESTGVTLPGLPFVLIGHNRRVAWGFTNSFADCQDLVIEEFDNPAGERYRTERGFERTRLQREIIHVKDASDEVEEVVITRHGPVVERIEDPARDVWRGLALQWTALTPGGSPETMLKLQRAGDWQSFRSAFGHLDAPSQNVVYADVDGHIGYLLCGRVPVRRRRPSGLPVQGWTGDALWLRFLNENEMPYMLDPPEQAIVTANNRITGSQFPHYIGSDFMNGYRALRIAELLREPAMDLGYMARMQMDVVCPPARQVVRLLSGMTCAEPNAERLRRRLVQWDASMSTELTEPTIYESFMHHLAEHALRPVCGDAWRIVAGIDLTHPVFEYPGNLAGRLTPALLDRWQRGDHTLLGGATWPSVATAALTDTWADLRGRYGRRSKRWRWGRVHALALTHSFGRGRMGRLIFNAGTIPIGGNVDTILATAHMPSEPFATRLLAPSWRQVLDVGNWDACSGVHLPGQSGQPGSRHYKDLRGPWRKNHQFPLLWSPQLVERNARTRLVMVPALAAGALRRPAEAEAA